MAVVFESIASAAVNASSSNNITINKPTGLAVGDLMIAIVGGPNDYSVNTKSGWTGLTQAQSVEGNQLTAKAQWKIADAADVAASTFVFSTNTGSGLTGCILRFSGHNPSAPINAENAVHNNTNTTTPSIACGITPAVANCMILASIWQAEGSTTTASGYAVATDSPTLTERLDQAGTVAGTSRGMSMHVATGERAATSATGNLSATMSNSGDRFVGILIAIAPLTSTDYPMTAALGTFTLTGIAASLKIGWKMLAAVGAFTLTGIAAALKVGTKMTAALGTFALTGINATLLYGKYLLASLGEFTLTGIDATITSTRKITADLGTFVLTGLDSILYVGHTLTAALGEFVLFGSSASLNGFRAMSAALGQFVLTGVDVALPRASKIFADVGTFTLTGIDTVLYAGKILVAALGEFTLTGVAALFPRASKIFANTGAFILTGIAAGGLLNGVSNFWVAASKTAVSTMANISKNAATWVNRLKS